MGNLAPAQEMAKWKAEGDAETLASAKAITLDADRLGAAQKAAKRLAKEAEEQAESQKNSSKAMKDLSKGSLRYSSMSKRKNNSK